MRFKWKKKWTKKAQHSTGFEPTTPLSQGAQMTTALVGLFRFLKLWAEKVGFALNFFLLVFRPNLPMGFEPINSDQCHRHCPR